MDVLHCSKLMTISLLAGALSLGSAALAGDQEGRRDNSGRQLAVVVPGVPRPTTAVPPMSFPAPKTISSVKPAPSGGGVSSRGERSDARYSRRLSNVGTPTELSPEVEAAIEQGTKVAQGLSRIAVKRASDVVGWMGTMWKHINEAPRLSPGRDFSPPTGSMRPIADTGRGRQLYFTSERRLKTVVGQ